eukprot:GHVH01005960.1.p1 GENE.GHVH01005960.1~~GHVH01005960.1.p1  ORF type:complete len:534 (-),score=61.09 GHVH01005960.1:1242-2843(-)
MDNDTFYSSRNALDEHRDMTHEGRKRDGVSSMSFHYLCLFSLIAILVLQAVITDYAFFLGGTSEAGYNMTTLLVYAVVDSLMLIQLLTHISQKNISLKCSILNFIHLCLLAMKSLSLMSIIQQCNLDIINPDLPNVVVMPTAVVDAANCFCFAALSVAIITVRCSGELYNLRLQCTSINSFVYTESSFRVVSDIFDLGNLMYNYADIHMALLQKGSVSIFSESLILQGCKVLMFLGFAMHAFSVQGTSPSFSTSKIDAVIDQHLRFDVFVSAKHINLVSMFVVNMPLLVGRCVLLSQIAWFDPFIVKNLLTIPLSALSLHRIGVIENIFFLKSDLLDKHTAANDGMGADFILDKPAPDYSEISRLPQSSRYMDTSCIAPKLVEFPIKQGKIDFNSVDMQKLAEIQGLKYSVLDGLIQDVQYVRQIPVRGFKFSILLRHVLDTGLGLNTTVSGAALLLDARSFRVKYWRMVLLTLSLLLGLASYCVIVLSALYVESSDALLPDASFAIPGCSLPSSEASFHESPVQRNHICLAM